MTDVGVCASLMVEVSVSVQIDGGRLIGGRVRIVKNELGGSATQQELRSWGGGVTME